MTTMAKRFLLGAAIIGSFVAGSVGIAQAQNLYGPYQWNASQFPNETHTGLYASNAYCWLGGFRLGQQQSASHDDQVYVFVDGYGEWILTGASATHGTAPSTDTWGEAFCVDWSSGGQNIFSPWGGYSTIACPSPTDYTWGGSCYLSQNGNLYFENPYTWNASGGLPSGNHNSTFQNTAWNNMFAAIMGIGYDGLSGPQQQMRYNVQTQPDTIFVYNEERVNAWIQLGNDIDNQIAYGGIWPMNNNHWFCAQRTGGDSRCKGVATTVYANLAGAVTQVVQSDNGVVAYACGAPAGKFNYVCQLNWFQTSGQGGEVYAQLGINTNKQWQLTVNGPSFYNNGNRIFPGAQVFCFPYPYSTSSP
jgi:hypothetical protein